MNPATTRLLALHVLVCALRVPHVSSALIDVADAAAILTALQRSNGATQLADADAVTAPLLPGSQPQDTCSDTGGCVRKTETSGRVAAVAAPEQLRRATSGDSEVRSAPAQAQGQAGEAAPRNTESASQSHLEYSSAVLERGRTAVDEQHMPSVASVTLHRSQTIAAQLRVQGDSGTPYYNDKLAETLPPSMLWDIQPYLKAAAERERRLRAGRVEEWPPNEYNHWCITAPVGKHADQCDPLGNVLFGQFVPNAPCPQRDRVGNVNDGGKWTCAPALVRAAPACVVYSFGVADDTSFEAAMLRNARNCSVFAFDVAFGTLLLAAEDADIAPRITYRQLGLAPVSHTANDGVPFASLRDIMAAFRHEYIDILKVDIEGAELDVGIQTFSEWARAGHTPVGQLLVELHLADASPWKIVAFFRAAEAAGLAPFHAELNPVPCVALSAMPRRPDFQEFSFVHIGNMRTRYDWSGAIA